MGEFYGRGAAARGVSALWRNPKRENHARRTNFSNPAYHQRADACAALSPRSITAGRSSGMGKRIEGMKRASARGIRDIYPHGHRSLDRDGKNLSAGEM